MPRQVSLTEINTWVGGVHTDATPLTFPDNVSLSEVNFVLNSEGDRQRRLGMDFESGGSIITSSVNSSDTIGHSSYRWENAGGNEENAILVVQYGNELKFYDLDVTPLSDGLLDTETVSGSVESNSFSYATVDGILVVGTGENVINIFEYDEDTQLVSHTTDTLKIRDQFGVEDIVDGDNLSRANNLSIRPTTKTDEHIYNLRNQGWGIPRIDGNNETLKDPIDAVFDTLSVYPSNADLISAVLYEDANDSDNRTIKRFFARDLKGVSEGSTEAPKGYFIIDALNRGTSRFEEYQANIDKYSDTTLITIGELPEDRTPGGCLVVSEFAGRVFYTGFSGKVVDGDSKSPKMSSYILFSKTVRDSSEITQCYQSADPTSADDPELVDTDGGFVRIDEAFGIKALKNLQGSLFIFAKNGVWRLVGSSETGFSATNLRVFKLSDRGIVGTNSVVETENSILYWGTDGIYRVATNQFGDWEVVSLTRNKIDSTYDQISDTSKNKVQGQYDSFDKKVRWIYDISLTTTSPTKELVLDAQLGSFYFNDLYPLSGSIFPKVVGIYEANPYTIATQSSDVVVGSDNVVVGADNVTVDLITREAVTTDVGYIIVNSVSPTIKYGFGSYSVTDFYDWKSVDGTGIDAAAYMVTGYISGGDFQRNKQVLYLTTHFRRTETGFDESFNLLNPSSCLVQFQWDWTNNVASNRWSSEFQAYRLGRLYMPDDSSDEYEDGETVVSTRHKVRGRGKVLSIKFSSEPGKDCHIYGWSMVNLVQGNV